MGEKKSLNRVRDGLFSPRISDWMASKHKYMEAREFTIEFWLMNDLIELRKHSYFNFIPPWINGNDLSEISAHFISRFGSLLLLPEPNYLLFNFKGCNYVHQFCARCYWSSTWLLSIFHHDENLQYIIMYWRKRVHAESSRLLIRKCIVLLHSIFALC